MSCSASSFQSDSSQFARVGRKLRIATLLSPSNQSSDFQLAAEHRCRMGVHGLWPLLHPVARPVALETMGGKKLAIDSSIWLYQFQIAMRDKDGRALDNAHILGFLRRICKLLFYVIKPVSFVQFWDMGIPTVTSSLKHGDI